MNGSELPIPGQLNAIGSTDIFWGEKNEERRVCPVSYSGLSGQKVGFSQSSHRSLVFCLTIE